MLRLTGKYTFSVTIFCVILISIGCSFFGVSGADTETEAQTAPETTPTNTPNPTPTPNPTSTPPPTLSPTSKPITTDLPTEIIEPISPISPVATVEESAMISANDSIELIPGSEEVVTAAIADLAKQTGIPPDQIMLVSMEAVDWNDTSLGCPQEGFMYAQVITPGYLLVLQAQDQQYNYHTDQTTNVVLCQE